MTLNSHPKAFIGVTNGQFVVRSLMNDSATLAALEKVGIAGRDVQKNKREFVISEAAETKLFSLLGRHKGWRILPEAQRAFGVTPTYRVIERVGLPAHAISVRLGNAIRQKNFFHLRMRLWKEARGLCECCGRANIVPETMVTPVFKFDVSRRIQKLERLQVECKECWAADQIPVGRLANELDPAVRHLRRVNGWTIGELRAARDETRAEYRDAPDTLRWTLDLQALDSYRPAREMSISN